MTIPTRRGTLRSMAAGGVIAIGLGTVLSACGDNGTALAKQACTHVNQSISLLQESNVRTDQAEAARLKERAYVELLSALPIAAEAASHDEQWQALMTTISEGNRVPETTLVEALTAQCKVADASTFDQPPPPSSIPPPNVGRSP
ncbi:MAG: hypothetical protein ACRDYE_08260 [Acidimicrobiales bacterium]